MLAADQSAEHSAAVSNHPLAFRMAVIAFITNNITIGVMATRHSLRLLMIGGAALMTAAFVLLAVSHSYPLYLVAYGLLLGPGMAVGVILCASLVTRWFVVHRGRALGIIYMPVVIALVPLTISWVLLSWGLSMSYWVLAALSAIALIANFFIVDHPPTTAAVVAPTVADRYSRRHSVWLDCRSHWRHQCAGNGVSCRCTSIAADPVRCSLINLHSRTLDANPMLCA